MANSLTKLACELESGDLVEFDSGPVEIDTCHVNAGDDNYTRITFVDDDGPGLIVPCGMKVVLTCPHTSLAISTTADEQATLQCHTCGGLKRVSLKQIWDALEEVHDAD